MGGSKKIANFLWFQHKMFFYQIIQGLKIYRVTCKIITLEKLNSLNFGKAGYQLELRRRGEYQSIVT